MSTPLRYRVLGLGADWYTDGAGAGNLPADTWDGGLPAVVDRVAPRFAGGEGTVVLSAPAAERLGLLPDLAARDGRPAVAAALVANGWTVGAEGKLGAWTTLYRLRGGPVVHVLTLPWVDTDDTARWPWGAELAGAAPGALEDSLIGLCSTLDDYHRLVGVPFRGRPGVAGVALLRAMLTPESGRGRAPLFISADGPFRQVADRPLLWERGELAGFRASSADQAAHVAQYLAAEEGWGWRHRYDHVAAYLGAANVAEVAGGPLVRTGRVLFDKRLAGYWEIPAGPTIDAVAERYPLMPPIVTAHREGETVWVTTPTVALLEQLGYLVEIRDAWTAPGRRLLRGWAERLRDVWAGTASVPALHKAVKYTFRETVGMLARRGGRVYRPDWALTIQAQERANLWRKMLGAGLAPAARWPLLVNTDCVTYAADSPDWRTSAPHGYTLVPEPGRGRPALGQFRNPDDTTTTEGVDDGLSGIIGD